MAARLKPSGDKTRVEALRNLRSTLEWLGDDVHYIGGEVDPIVEMCSITKAFDNSKVERRFRRRIGSLRLNGRFPHSSGPWIA